MANTNTNPSGYQYILAYGLATVILVFFAKTKFGYSIIYYALVLSVILVLLVDAQWISNTLKPITQPASYDVSNPGAGASTQGG
jgi:hypothetical protein